MNDFDIDQIVKKITEELSHSAENIPIAEMNGEVAQVVAKVIKETNGFANGNTATPGKAVEGDRVIVTAFGLNKVGIIAGLSSLLAELNVDILDISPKRMQNFFAVILLADISGMSCDFSDLKGALNELAKSLGIRIFTQHEEVFRYMQRI